MIVPFSTDGVSRLSGLCLVRSCSAHENPRLVPWKQGVGRPGRTKNGLCGGDGPLEIFGPAPVSVDPENPERDDFRGHCNYAEGVLVR